MERLWEATFFIRVMSPFWAEICQGPTLTPENLPKVQVISLFRV